MTDEIKKCWWEYHQRNPQVYTAFKRFTFQAIGSKRQRFSSMAVIQRMRWESMVSGDDDFKINNNYAPYYARLFMKDFPQYEGFFETRSIA